MKKLLIALGAAFAAIIAAPASATTFPTLTTIYVGAGVTDDGGANDTGLATVFLCSNVSGAQASVRWLILNVGGSIHDQATRDIAHGETAIVSTHHTTTFSGISLGTGAVQGVINIESTESAVFCTALIVDAADAGEGMPLHLVRVNPHSGTVE